MFSNFLFAHRVVFTENLLTKISIFFSNAEDHSAQNMLNFHFIFFQVTMTLDMSSLNLLCFLTNFVLYQINYDEKFYVFFLLYLFLYIIRHAKK